MADPIGPCGELFQAPDLTLRRVGDLVEFTLASSPYGWRLRFWMSAAEAREYANEIEATAFD